jgi:LPXTG-motif cell wall-anchored protein
MAALAAAALSFIALPGAAAAYPPEPPQQSVDVESVTVVCVGPTPYIEYELTTEGFDQPEDLTATVTVLDGNGNVLSGPTAGQSLSGQLPHPGDEQIPGLRLNAEVSGVGVTALVQYPPESVECLSGQVSPQGASRAGQLPSTGGSDPSGLIWIAAATLLAGAAIWGVSFRRGRPIEPTT